MACFIFNGIPALVFLIAGTVLGGAIERMRWVRADERAARRRAGWL